MTPQPPPTTWRHPGGTPHRRDTGEYRRHLKVWRRGGTPRQPGGGTLAAPEQLTLDLQAETDWHAWFVSLPLMLGSTTTVRESITNGRHGTREHVPRSDTGARAKAGPR